MTRRPLPQSLLLLSGLVRSGLGELRKQYPAPEKVNTCNLSPEQIAERDRPISRQERRQKERLKAKGRDT